MAPEVQGPGYGLSADLWSAGCLFYTMVTGSAPFQGHRVGDTLANARAGRYVEPEGLSAEAKDFLACMLSLVRFFIHGTEYSSSKGGPRCSPCVGM